MIYRGEPKEMLIPESVDRNDGLLLNPCSASGKNHMVNKKDCDHMMVPWY